MKVAMKNTHLLAKRSRLEEVPLVAPETAGRAVALGPAELLVVLPSQEETAGGSGRQREAGGQVTDSQRAVRILRLSMTGVKAFESLQEGFIRILSGRDSRQIVSRNQNHISGENAGWKHGFNSLKNGRVVS